MMDEFRVNKKSWHYRLMMFNSSGWNETARSRIVTGMLTTEEAFEQYCHKPTNFCEYWRRAVVWPFINAGIFAIMLYYIIYSLLATKALGLLGMTAILLAGAVGVVALAAAVHFSKKLFDKRVEMFSNENTSNIVVTAYKTWKDKYCPSVKYDGDTK